MSGQGYHILLECRRRSEVLRGKGFSYDQIADVLALDHEVSPLRLYRYAHGRTAADFEAGSRRSSGQALAWFAQTYQTTARQL